MRWLLLLMLAAATPLAAQGSPFIPLDHPLLPLAEYLIARGELVDPSPMVRPFRRADLVAAIDKARLDSTTASGRIAQTLRAAFADRPEDNWVKATVRAGAQSFTRGRRDLLHPAGDGGTTFYAEAALEGRFGNLVMAARPVADNSLKRDPDWSGASLQTAKTQAYRFAEGYLSAQFPHIRLFYGQMDRNWGPVGTLGLSIANYSYPRTDLAVGLSYRDLQLDIVAAELNSMEGGAGLTRRMFLAHRLNVRVTHRLNLAIWETGILAQPPGSADPSFKNPLILLSFPIQLGLPDDRNTIIGGDLGWRVGRVLVEGQAMIDDMRRGKADPNGTGELAHPGRWALSGAITAPVGQRASWRSHLEIVNSLAYRTTDSTQSYLDRGIGIGPNFTDQLTIGTSLAIPVLSRWLVTPDLTLLAQGEGRINAPFPTGTDFADTPELFIGRTARTIRLGLTVAGATGRFQIDGTGGYFHTTDADHLAGFTRDRFEGRLRITIGVSKQGPIQ